VVVSDVTSARRAERAVAVRDAQQRTLLETAPDTFITVARDGRVRAMRGGGDQADSELPVVARFSDLLLPEHRRTAESAVARAALSGQVVELDARGKTADRGERDYHVRLRRLPGEKDSTDVLAVVRDETERVAAFRRAEEALRRQQLIIGQLPLLMYEATVGEYGPEFVWLQGDCELVLGAPQGRVVGTTVWPTSRTNARTERMMDDWEGLRLGALERWSVQHRRTGQDGTNRWLLDVGGIHRGRGRGAPIIGFILDVTEQRTLAESITRAQKLEAVGRLAGGVAHDFNNLLTTVNGCAAFLRADLGEGDARLEDVDEIMLASERAAALTRQLLAFSRHQPMEFEHIDVGRHVKDLERLLRRTIGEDIDLRVELQAEDAVVLISPSQLDQLVLNLSINARDAMPDGGALTVRVSTTAIDDGHPTVRAGDYVRLEVEDDGEGMTGDVLARVFEPYFTTKPAGKGTGLGLATCHGLLRQLGGAMDVSSTPGTGTCMTALLPRATIRGTPVPQRKVRRKGHGGDESILLVEDDGALRRVAARALRGAGFKVVEAEDGEAAIGILDDPSMRLDLVLSDMVMPKRGGQEVAAHTRRVRPGCRILMTTGWLGEQASRGGVAQSGPAVLWKPYTIDTLLDATRAALDGPPAPGPT